MDSVYRSSGAPGAAGLAPARGATTDQAGNTTAQAGQQSHAQPQQAQTLSPAESLRYMSWYGAMIVSHYYMLEQSFLQSSAEDPYAQQSTQTHRSVNAVAVMDAWSMITADDSDEDASGDKSEDKAPEAADADTGSDVRAPRRRLRRPSILLFTWWKRQGTSEAGGVSVPTPAALIQAFDRYFFPSFLFADPHAADGEGGGQPGGPHHTPSTTGGSAAHAHHGSVGASAAATEGELRAAFHAFLELGHKVTYPAIAGYVDEAAPLHPSPSQAAAAMPVSAPAPVHPTSDNEFSTTPPASIGGLHPHAQQWQQGSGFNGSPPGATVPGSLAQAAGGVADTSSNATANSPSSWPNGNNARSTRKAVLTLLYSLAFDCPCAPLACAAQLLLAEATARLPACTSAALAAEFPDLELTSFNRAPAHEATSANRPVPQPSPERGQRPLCEENTIAHLLALLPRMERPAPSARTNAAAPNPLSPAHVAAEGNASDELCFSPREGETLLWVDPHGQPHVCSAADWLGLPTSGDGSEAQRRRQQRLQAIFGEAQTVRCGALSRAPTLQALDRLLLRQQGLMSGELATMERAMESAVEACAAEALSARSGGTVGRRRRGVPGHGTSPLSSNAAGTGSLAGGQGSVPATVPATRNKQLLCVLSRCHVLVPQSQRLLADELLYSIFTEHGECPSYLKVLAVYPDILRAHYTADRYVLFDEGPLPLDERLMIAIMAASRHRCEYLVCRYAALLLRYTSSADVRAGEEAATAAVPSANPSGSRDNHHHNANSRSSGRGGGAAHADDGRDASGGVPGGDDLVGLHASSRMGTSVSSSAEGQPSDAGDETDEGPNYRRPKNSQESDGGNALARSGNGEGRSKESAGGSAAAPAAAAATAAGGAATSGAAGSAGAAGRATAATVNKHERWLLEGPPPRLQAVQRFIGLAAHTPWRIDEETVREVLLSGWTVPEVFQLTAILAHVVPLSAFVMGLDVPVDPWTLATLPPAMLSRLHSQRTGTGGGGATGRASSSSSPAPSRTPKHGSMQDLNIHKSESQGCLDPAFPTEDDGRGAEVDVFGLYTGVDDIVSEQRIKGNTNSVSMYTLWREQFSWQEVGSTYMEQYYPGAAAYLNEEFDSFGDLVRQVNEGDCVSLKYAQVNPAYAFLSLQLYVLNVLGFMVEDYPYNEINRVLLRPAKWVAQALTMRPEALSRQDVRRWATCAASLPPTAATADAGRLSATASSSQRTKQEVDLLAAGHKMGPTQSLLQPSMTHTLSSPDSPHTADSEDGGSGAFPTLQARAEAEAQALTAALELQDNRVLLLIMLATMFARAEGLLHILLYPLCTVLSNM